VCLAYGMYHLACAFGSLRIQSTLDIATMCLAANLDLTTSRALTDFRQHINSDLEFSDLEFSDPKFQPICSDIATVEVVMPSGLEQKF